jgi:hypothetical protein
MDAPTATLLAGLGGFLAAFLAEPIKSLIQYQFKKSSLRNALYKELLQNYDTVKLLLWELSDEVTEADARGFAQFAAYSGHIIFRTECYHYAISNDFDLFYRLPDYAAFNRSYMLLTSVTNLPPNMPIESASLDKAMSRPLIGQAREFLSEVECSFEKGELDKHQLKRVLGEPYYSYVISEGKKKLAENQHYAKEYWKAKDSEQTHIDNSGEAPASER